jgi:oligoribonuclease
MVSPSNDRLVWIDCEMTGLDSSRDELVEVAVVITDYELTVMDPGFQVVIKPSDAALSGIGDFVRQMHTDSGLIDEIPKGHSLEEAEGLVFDYITSLVPEPGLAPMAGNTIGTDRVFIQKEMPRVHEHLHYRNIDVSTIKELAKRWLPPAYFLAPTKNGGHRALADIRESIRELQYYRAAVFQPAPGMAKKDLTELAATVTAQWDSQL